MRHWWLVLEPPAVDLCLKDPGHEVDLYVHADLYAMTQVWVRERTFADAARTGAIALHGPPALVKAFPGWLKLGAFPLKPASPEPETRDPPARAAAPERRFGRAPYFD